MIMKGSKELEMEKWIEKGNVLIEANHRSWWR